MKVRNMQSTSGNDVPNQFIIEDDKGRWFQSYNSMIAFIPWGRTGDEAVDPKIQLDGYYWNYSKTTAKYRNLFFNETTKDTEKKINAGIYQLVDLNK